MAYLKFDLKLSIFLITAFIVVTIAGTLTHELAHYSAAQILGHNASINYKSTSYQDNNQDYLKEIYRKHQQEIRSNSNFPEKEKYANLTQRYQSDNFLIILAGPLQTIITGTIGLLLLLIYRQKHVFPERVSLTGWSLVFLSLFWLRQIANFIMALLSYATTGQASYRGDEAQLAYHLDINVWSIQIVAAAVGLSVLALVLKILPKKIVFTFIISGLVGGFLGYYLWLVKFGKIIMP